MLYNIYAGLNGSFGGIRYQCTCDYDTDHEALEYAYNLACGSYESYAGLHGLKTFGDAIKEAYELGEFDKDTPQDDLEFVEYAEDIYNEYMEGWLTYSVVAADEDPNTEKLKENNEYQLVP